MIGHKNFSDNGLFKEKKKDKEDICYFALIKNPSKVENKNE